MRPAVMTLISFVMPPTPVSRETAANAASFSSWCLTLPLRVQPAARHVDVDVIGRNVFARDQRLQRTASDLAIAPAIARIKREFVVEPTHAACRSRDLGSGAKLVQTADGAAEGHGTPMLRDRDLRGVGDPIVAVVRGSDLFDD